MQNTIVQTKQSEKFKLPVDVIVGAVYTVETESADHVKLFGVEHWVSKDCIDFVDHQVKDFRIVVEERTITVKSYRKQLLLNGKPVVTGQQQDWFVQIVGDDSSPIYRKDFPEFESGNIFEMIALDI